MELELREPEALLEQMFLIRHELITARTMAAQTHDIFSRWPRSSAGSPTRTAR